MNLDNDVTLVVKTFDRPNLLHNLMRSVRRFHPGLPVIVVDDGRSPFVPEQNDPNLRCIRTDFDIGLSAGRNLGVEHVSTAYCMIIDDDFAFTSGAALERLLRPVAEFDFAICGGRMLNFGIRDIPYHGVFEEEDRALRLLNGTSHGTRDGYPLLDYCHNVFCAPTSLLRQHRWDERLKVHEHWEFFYRLRKSLNVDVTMATDVGFAHFPIRPRHYKRFRNKRDYFEDFALQISGLASVEVVGETPRLEGIEKLRHSAIKRAYGVYLGALRLKSRSGNAMPRRQRSQ